MMYEHEIEDFKVEFGLEVMSELYNLVYKQGVENIVIMNNSIGNIVDLSVDSAGNAIGILGKDESEVVDELERLYEEAFENVSERMEQQTKECLDISSDTQFREYYIITWKGEEGWVYCFYGVTNGNISFESEEVYPFPNREEAIQDALDTFYEEDKY